MIAVDVTVDAMNVAADDLVAPATKDVVWDVGVRHAHYFSRPNETIAWLIASVVDATLADFLSTFRLSGESQIDTRR